MCTLYVTHFSIMRIAAGSENEYFIHKYIDIQRRFEKIRKYCHMCGAHFLVAATKRKKIQFLVVKQVECAPFSREVYIIFFAVRNPSRIWPDFLIIVEALLNGFTFPNKVYKLDLFFIQSSLREIRKAM